MDHDRRRARVSFTDVITDHRGRRRQMVDHSLITAQELEFLETVAAESGSTQERILDMLAWLLANTAPSGHEIVEYVGLGGELQEFPHDLVAHPDVIIALHENLHLLDGLESKGVVAALVCDASEAM